MKIDINNPPQKYRVIYADPAWTFSNRRTGGSMRSAAEAHYTVTSMKDMEALPVSSLADDDCLLVMWWVGAMPAEALRLCETWGFELVTMTGFVWRKLTRTGLPFFGMGFTTRAGAECALIARRGKLSNLIQCHGVRSVIEAPVGRHSEKPQAFRDAIELLCGDVPRVELFARQAAPGWHCWGDQAPDVETPANDNSSLEWPLEA